ncbi:MAG: hypothetical protein LBF37_01025 [Rickettsiales bacterium]|jgi:hypothetical protein|nr:hypothetical protein [Rickettsiales bacterium]
MKKILILFIIVVLSACSSQSQYYTAVSTNSIDPTKNISDAEIIKNVRGRDRLHFITFIPIGRISQQDAVKDALVKADADLLINAKIYAYNWWIPYIYGQSSWIVEADAVKFKK